MKITEMQKSDIEYKVTVQRKCDLCSKTTNGPDWWTDHYTDVEETEIKIVIKGRSGTNYGTEGHGKELEIDLCPECFKQRFVAWLKSEGADIDYSEYSY